MFVSRFNSTNPCIATNVPFIFICLVVVDLAQKTENIKFMNTESTRKRKKERKKEKESEQEKIRFDMNEESEQE